jgi:hypothetical protein
MSIRVHVVTLLGVCMAGCSAGQLGLPRVPVSATSPDSGHVAFVRNHPNIDPPSQSIWLSAREGTARQIQRLGPDSDWCNLVVWSPDSSTVAFLIQDARLITVDAASQQIVSDQWLTPWQGEYPPYQMAIDLSLDRRGTEARFRLCERHMTRPGYVHDAVGCSDFRRVMVRPRA